MLLMLTLAGTKDNVIQTGTVNLHFLIPGTSEPVSATVSILQAVFLCERCFVCIDDWRVHVERPPCCHMMPCTSSHLSTLASISLRRDSNLKTLAIHVALYKNINGLFARSGHMVQNYIYYSGGSKP